MNQIDEPIYIGEFEDIEKGSVENFEHEEIEYAIYHLESGFFATQGHCNCKDQALLSEGEIEGDELECPSCRVTYSIVSGDAISDPESLPLKIYDITEEKGLLYLNL